ALTSSLGGFHPPINPYRVVSVKSQQEGELDVDVASVRGLYTGLSDGWTYLNAHDTPQIAERVSAGVARAFRMSPAVAAVEASSGSHSAPVTAGRLEREDFIATARMAIADMKGG